MPRAPCHEASTASRPGQPRSAARQACVVAPSSRSLSRPSVGVRMAVVTTPRSTSARYRLVRALPLLLIAASAMTDLCTPSQARYDAMHTDGVSETRDDKGASYPLDERLAAWAAEPDERIPTLLSGDLHRFSSHGLDDDTAAVLIAHR
ncbi:SpoIIE family protein phosphatase [Streptomyces sp. NPDC058623]|uniref:SpoIIE family protein phosphatase n=1 Tax=Streptomyces sp. NPDC058623 TaxID=3346563 RepID=UPI003658A992